jgi:hypothetical protein
MSAFQLRFDRLDEKFEEQFEVGVSLPGGLAVEAACDLAEREAQDRGAQQSLHLVCAPLGDAGFCERAADGVSCLVGFVRGCRSLKQEGERARVAVGGGAQIVCERGETFSPGKLRGGLYGFGEQQLHEPVEQVGLIGDVPVKRHCRHVEPLGKRGHCDCVEAAFVSKSKSFREDERSIDSCRSTHDISV